MCGSNFLCRLALGNESIAVLWGIFAWKRIGWLEVPKYSPKNWNKIFSFKQKLIYIKYQIITIQYLAKKRKKFLKKLNCSWDQFQCKPFGVLNQHGLWKKKSYNNKSGGKSFAVKNSSVSISIFPFLPMIYSAANSNALQWFLRSGRQTILTKEFPLFKHKLSFLCPFLVCTIFMAKTNLKGKFFRKQNCKSSQSLARGLDCCKLNNFVCLLELVLLIRKL